ncbi:hypothetical protein PGTUg99_025158 [Puccinia graminis f. sp. tritici]|uniref:Uncharacterized protein n=1 Tax=Puccinia graminis f. sp. tritici TaxID=56615 RepID=A0A5B0RZ57_PUCGR|nr:hypothetical protein PGTUg99_025158 [Puccinia graminis f. sp. tritici]
MKLGLPKGGLLTGKCTLMMAQILRWKWCGSSLRFPKELLARAALWRFTAKLDSDEPEP